MSQELDALAYLAGDLMTAGYHVEFEDKGDGTHLSVTGRGIKGRTLTSSRTFFIAENEHAFDKWSTAPLRMWLPCDMARLLPALELLATEEGERLSNRFICDSLENPFPYEREER